MKLNYIVGVRSVNFNMKLIYASLLLLAGCGPTTYVGSLGEYQAVCDRHPTFTCTVEVSTTEAGVEARIFPYRKGLGGPHSSALGLYSNITPAELDRVLTALEAK